MLIMFLGQSKLIPWSRLSICEISHDKVRVFISLFLATKTLWSPHFALLQCNAISCYEKCKSAAWFAKNHLLHKMLYSNRVLFMTSDASYYFFLSKLFTMYDLIQTNVLNWKKTLYNWNSSFHIKLSLRSPSYSLGTQKSENNT